jgi:hypothetical protein
VDLPDLANQKRVRNSTIVASQRGTSPTYTFGMNDWKWVIYSIIFIASALSAQQLLNLVARRVVLVRRYKDELSIAIALLAFVWMAWFAVYVLKV